MKTLKTIGILLLLTIGMLAQAQHYSYKGAALFRCVTSNNIDSARLLLRMGANPDYAHNNYRPLMHAVENQSHEMVKLLLKYKADPNAKPIVEFPLSIAVQLGNYEIAYTLLNHGADPNLKNKGKPSALILACQQGDFDIASMLLNFNAQLEQKDADQNTALHHAVLSGVYNIIEMLLYYGADINATNNEGDQAIHMSMFILNPDIHKLLLNNGASTSKANKKGYTPLMLAIQEQNTAAAKLIIEAGGEIKGITSSGYSAFSLAILTNNHELIKLLAKKVPTEIHQIDQAGYPMKLAQLYARDKRFLLRRMGYKTNYSPLVRSFSMELGNIFNLDDALYKYRFSAHDHRYFMTLGTGISTRFIPKQIESTNQYGNQSYLYERRLSFDSYLEKRFLLYTNPNNYSEAGLYTGLNFQYMLSNYVYVPTKSEKHFYTIPYAGFYYAGDFLFARFGYAYTNYQYEFTKVNKHRIELSFGLIFGDIHTLKEYSPHIPKCL
jgi:ankyrin repeat protein